MLLILIGASASGKTFLLETLQEKGLIKRMITSTTRQPREGEIDGIDYHFLTKDTFDVSKMAEHVTFAGNLYGTSIDEVQQAIQSKDVYMVIMENKGATLLREQFGSSNGEIQLIWIKRSKSKCYKRLIQREGNWQKARKRFIDDKKNGLYDFKDYDYMIENKTSKDDFVSCAIDLIENIKTVAI